MADDQSGLGRDLYSNQNFMSNILSKLQNLDSTVRELRQNQNDTTKMLQNVSNEKSDMQNELNEKTNELTGNLNLMIEEMLSDLKKHQHTQRSSGLKIQNDISVLKKEKLELQQRIVSLTKRIQDMETTIGAEVK